MHLRSFLGIAGILAVAAGLPFIFFPEQSLALYGLETDAAGLLLTRYFGSAFLSFGVLIWFVREAIDPDEHRHILIPLMICALVGLGISLMGQLSGLVNALGWVTVVIFAAFAGGFLVYRGR